MPKHQPKVYINLRVQTDVFYEIYMYTWMDTFREIFLSLSYNMDVQQTEVKSFLLK